MVLLRTIYEDTAMAFIKVQKLVLDEDGRVKSGSAAIVETAYDSTYSGKSRHRVRERLGKIITLSADGKSGLFLSPTRGLVHYDSVSDGFEEVGSNDPRTEELELFADPVIHTVFGDAYLFLVVCEKAGLLGVLRSVFQKESEYERVVAHLAHSVLRNGSKICCDDFITKSFVSYLLGDLPVSSLSSDTAYFSLMGNDTTKVAFFRCFVTNMRKSNPSFGKGCYVDSTPLPNSISGNPFNALCSHGLKGVSVQMRLVLILDEQSGLPVWYDVVPGNLLDLSTLRHSMEDVAETLDIRISNFTLDAGYASKELFEYFSSADALGKHLLLRMPAKKGYPYKTLYHKYKTLLSNAKYEFVRQGHTYFGYRASILIFDVPMNAYIYVDKDNALERARAWRLEHEQEYARLSDAEKNWHSVRYGYFILLSTEEKEPKLILDDYFGRTHIEGVFKTRKEYLDLLPLSKWSDLTVRGKILSDIIATTAFLQLRKRLGPTGTSTTRMIGKSQSLMCTKKKDGMVIAETPNKQVKNLYEDLKVKIPSSIDVKQFAEETLGLILKQR